MNTGMTEVSVYFDSEKDILQIWRNCSISFGRSVTIDFSYIIPAPFQGGNPQFMTFLRRGNVSAQKVHGFIEFSEIPPQIFKANAYADFRLFQSPRIR